jgi:anhydro-N-acetylmuramic acid kinase
MKVLGIMSGTSMDGVDLALCDVKKTSEGWQSQIIQGVTVPYNESWRVRLSQLRYQNAEVYAKTDVFYGRYLGELAAAFFNETGLKADLIASHGHTIFHTPKSWVTAQIGDGATLNAFAKVPVVSNFRRADVGLGGQGAPLVGMGDQALFGEYDFCLNLGGFCNISASNKGKRIAFDIAPCNIVLNRLARERDLQYDENGALAEAGEIDYTLLNALNEIEFYGKEFPKSLGREWINKNFWHIVREFDDLSVEDRMKTLVMHIAVQVRKAVEAVAEKPLQDCSILVTGGGAFNECLIDHLRSELECVVVVPDANTINYKEALIFALLGAMRVHNICNTLSSATGATSDWVAGSLDGDFGPLMAELNGN